MSPNELKNQLPLPERVRRWFKDALGTDDPRPSTQQCEELARTIQIIIDKEHNRRLIAKMGVEASRDQLKISYPSEMIDVLTEEVRDAASHLLFTMTKLQKFVGENASVGLTEPVTYQEIVEFTAKIGVLAPKKIRDTREISYATRRHLDGAADEVREPDGSISYSDVIDKLADGDHVGRSIETYEAGGKVHEIKSYSGTVDFLDTPEIERAWPPEVGQKIADEVKSVMKKVGYRRSLSASNPASVTAIVGVYRRGSPKP